MVQIIARLCRLLITAVFTSTGVYHVDPVWSVARISSLLKLHLIIAGVFIICELTWLVVEDQSFCFSILNFTLVSDLDLGVFSVSRRHLPAVYICNRVVLVDVLLKDGGFLFG